MRKIAWLPGRPRPSEGFRKNASPRGRNCGRPTASLRHSPTAILILTDALFSSCLSRGYRAEDVVPTLERVCADTGYPKKIRIDQGTEFVSRDLDLWAYAKGVTLDFSWPGEPTDNAFIEAFNGRFRAECLNAHWFLTLADAKRKVGGLAQGPQRGSTTRGHRQQTPD